MIRFDYNSQCYVRDGYAPFPRSEVVKELKALEKDGHIEERETFTRLINREPMDFCALKFKLSLSYTHSRLYVLLAFSEHFPR